MVMTNGDVTSALERELVITRVLDAPRALVFAAWTQREHLMRWCAPQGFSITHCEGDLRPGCSWRTCMRSPEGIDHWVGGMYCEIVPDERLVFTHAWEEEDGTPGHETLVTVDFANEGEGKTKLTFRQTGFASTASRDGHEGGWSESFDNLQSLLTTLQSKSL